VSDVQPQLAEALRAQLARRPGGADRVGWKIGAGERESIRGDIAVGHLTSATVLAPGSTYRGGGEDLHADAEVALELVDERTVAAYGVALEIVDLAGDDDPSGVVAANVFHRAVAFGPGRPILPTGVRAALIVNGEVRASAPVANDFSAQLADAARLLHAVGEELRAGDRLIAGSVVQVPVERGDVVVAEMSELGRVRLAVA
jgi:hypothetical protein